MQDLSGRTALVTGGGGGIGAAIAEALAAHGASVAVIDIDEARARETAARAATHGVRTLAIAADCGDVAAIRAMVTRAAEAFGGLDIAVHNAGVSRVADITALTEDDWDHVNRLNAKGVFFGMQAAAIQMIGRGRGGRIVNLSSISGRGHARSSSAVYAASKGAVNAMTRVAALQLARHDITVNAICPGPTVTELLTDIAASRAAERGMSVEAMLAESASFIPLGRANTPQDVAALAVFLASDGARNVTGQCWHVDGGLVPS